MPLIKNQQTVNCTCCREISVFFLAKDLFLDSPIHQILPIKLNNMFLFTDALLLDTDANNLYEKNCQSQVLESSATIKGRYLAIKPPGEILNRKIRRHSQLHFHCKEAHFDQFISPLFYLYSPFCLVTWLPRK